MEENKIIEMETKEEEKAEVTTVKEEEKVSFGKKVRGTIKKHGKKIAIIGAGLAATSIGYVLGRRNGSEADDFTTDVEVEVETE